MIIRKFSEIWLFLSWDAAFPKSCKFVKNNSVLLPTWLINQVAENKKVRLFWTQTKTISTSTNRNTVNFDEIISNIMSFLIAKNSLPLPSPDLTKNFPPVFLPMFFCGYFRTLFSKLKIQLLQNRLNNYNTVFFMLYLILSILLSLKDFRIAGLFCK